MIDADEITLVRASIANVLETCSPRSTPDALLELGWAELLASDAGAVVRVTAEEHGARRAATATLDLVALDAAGLPVRASIAVVWPPLMRTPSHSGLVERGTVHVDGIALAGHERAEEYLVVAAGGLWQVPAAALKSVVVGGDDPGLALARVTGDVPTDVASLVGDADAVMSLMAGGRRFLASELIGLADAMLAEARDYVLARNQFGHPIAVFQTVKHRLADVHVAIAAARAGITTAWSDGTGTSAVAAKCLAGRAHSLAVTHCHQVQGGIAFTVEHGFHDSIRRGHALDALLGTTRDLTRALGAQLLADARLPRTPRVSP